MRQSAKRAKWLRRQLVGIPLTYTLVTTPKMLEQELRRLNIPREKWCETPFPDGTTGARCMQFTSKSGDCSAIVCVRTDVEGDTGAEIASRIVHEAMHIWRWVREILGEHQPSSELEAYAMENITYQLFTEFARQTGGKP